VAIAPAHSQGQADPALERPRLDAGDQPEPGQPGQRSPRSARGVGTDAWAVGSTKNGTKESSLILRWNGHTWNRISSPSPGSTSLLYSVAATSRTDAWAAGIFSNGV